MEFYIEYNKVRCVCNYIIHKLANRKHILHILSNVEMSRHILKKFIHLQKITRF